MIAIMIVMSMITVMNIWLIMMILIRAALEEKRKEGHITPFGQNLRMDVTELDQGGKWNDDNGDDQDETHTLTLS